MRSAASAARRRARLAILQLRSEFDDGFDTPAYGELRVTPSRAAEHGSEDRAAAYALVRMSHLGATRAQSRFHLQQGAL